MSEKIGEEIQVLDNGFVSLVDFFGSDSEIVRAARVSYAQGTKIVSEDEELIRYLMRYEHYSPFAMAQVKFHIRLPIFVHNQWVRHDRLHWNLISARYSIMPKEKWLSKSSWRAPSSSNKQAGEKLIDSSLTDVWRDLDYIPTTMNPDTPTQAYLDELQTNSYHSSESAYQRLIRTGVCREQARSVLPMGQYTEAFVTANLGDWMLFLRKRLDSHAQKEIQEYAGVIFAILNDIFPVSMKAFVDYQQNARIFSRCEMNILLEVLNSGVKIFDLSSDDRVKLLEKHGLKSKRERIEFFSKLK